MSHSGDALTVLVVNQYYAPDIAATGQLAAELCAGLVERGFQVDVVTGQPSYTASAPHAPQSEVIRGVRVHRVSLGGSKGREALRSRLAGYARFLAGAWRAARSRVRAQKPDAILTFHNPPFVGMIGAYLARRHGLVFTYVLHDIHPDILVATGWMRLPRPAVWLWERTHRWILRRADVIVVLGEGMKQTLVTDKGIPADRVHVVPLWARPELEPLARDDAVRGDLGVGDDELFLLYAGNMGIMHPLEQFVDAAAMLRGLPIRWLFIGDGAKRRSLEERVERERLDHVTLLPFQSEDRFAAILAGSDACLIALQPGLDRLAVPSRAYTFLSAARPLITLMAPDADIARLAVDDGCGWNVTGARELAELLRGLVREPSELVRRGADGRRVYEERFRRDRIIDQYARILERALAR